MLGGTDRMRRVEYFFEKTLPGQFISVACAAALPYLLLQMLEVLV